MVCEKCGDKGFVEKEHGLIMELCDCEKGKELRASLISQGIIRGDIIDGSNRGTEPDNQPSGGGNKPKKRKRKSKKT